MGGVMWAEARGSDRRAERIRVPVTTGACLHGSGGAGSVETWLPSDRRSSSHPPSSW